MSPLRRRLREERGESLTGLLVAMTLLVIVLGATLFTYESARSDQHESSIRVDAQDAARRTVEALARDLRNLASPTLDQPNAIDSVSPSDLVFKTVAPESPGEGDNLLNVMRRRYCLDAASNRLITQTQTWTTASPPAVPSTAGCPATGWNGSDVVVESIVNDARPVFSVDATVLNEITSIHVDLFVDEDSTDTVPETSISSGVFLRNQNRHPVASFTATSSTQGIVLNGSASYDPEGQPLKYEWYDGGVLVGTGITFTYEVAAGTTHSLVLRVLDPADLSDDSDPQEVTA